MARFVFVSLYDEFTPGVRTIIATLKRAGHFAALIAFKSYTQTPLSEVTEFYEGMHIQVLPTGDHVNSYAYAATQKEYDLLLNLIRELKPDLLGISLTFVQKHTAGKLTDLIRKETGLPIIWGGPNPTTDPEYCIQRADYVCRGEGETVLLDIAERIDSGKPFTDVANIWSRLPNGEIIRNVERPILEDLDSLPFPDYSKESSYYLDRDEIRHGIPFPESDLNTNYIVMTARGCPFACTYCYQSYVKTLYPGQKFVRERSIDNVLCELRQAKERLGHFYLEILDNVFTLKPWRVEEFSKRYHAEINEPFWCYTHPRCCKDETIKPLAECPNFEYIIMGIESASEHIGKEVFHRVQSSDEILKAARVLNKHGICANYDLITNVPGETEGDCWENLNMLRALPKPFRLRLSKLSLFPNYEVEHDRKGKERLVTEKRYRIWNALYFLTQDMDFTDDELDAILEDPMFEAHPEILEKLNMVFDCRWEDLTTMTVKHRLKSIDLQCALEREENMRRGMDALMGRKGMRQFLWLHDGASRVKGRLKRLI